MGVGDRRVLLGPPVAAEQPLQKVGGVHPDGAVDLPHRHLVSGLVQCLPPGHGVEVVGVGEGAVDVEDRRPRLVR